MENIKTVFSGSGTLLFYHLGADKKIKEKYNIINRIGTSGGAIAQAFSKLYTQKDIESIIKEFDLAKMKDLNISWNPLGLIKGNNILNFFKKYFNYQFKDIDNLSVIATKVSDLSETIFNKQNTPDIYLFDALRCSMSIAGVFAPHIINGEMYIDGGYCDNVAYDYFGKDKDVIAVTLNDQLNNYQVNNIIDAVLIGQYASIKSNQKKHLEDNQNCKVINLITKENSLSFSFTQDQINDMINSGYNQTDKILKA